MTTYKPRKIRFEELHKVNGWQIKIYTIAKHGDFDNTIFYNNAKGQLIKWLALTNGFNSKHNNIGFLILHAGTEGIFSLINWWVGDNMLNTHIFKTDYNNLTVFEKVSGNGLAPCVWELEVINHERLAWTNYVLKQEPQPDYNTYLNTTFSKAL
ncbi:hypothetical protein [Winogradskyella luteola]|uniref:Uncharacterized protein n=1 Tax=Winogradskyella luteola TaxID=2828330 RepID=A0A9X1FAA7_9FLAO|nr:hypothetical protein [Winogradskyella luteola]MBV7269298.1 hypothetical protein [Winogradskyella luteola]